MYNEFSGNEGEIDIFFDEARVTSEQRETQEGREEQQEIDVIKQNTSLLR